MNPTFVGMIVFACTLGGVLLGMWLRTILPERHLDTDSKDTVKLGAGLIAIMTALVLGLVTASAKSSFDTVSAAVKNTAIDILTLDRVLGFEWGFQLGPKCRELLLVQMKLLSFRCEKRVCLLNWQTQQS